MPFAIWSLALILLTYSFFKDRVRTQLAMKSAVNAFIRIIPGLIGMIVILGISLSLIPQETIIKLFNTQGWKGIVTVTIVGSIVTIPGPIAFPLAGSLLRSGVSPSILASFITSLTMVGIITLPLEISYFGKNFSITRQLLSFFSALGIGLIMGGFL